MRHKYIYAMTLLLGSCLFAACGKGPDKLGSLDIQQSVEEHLLSEALASEEKSDTELTASEGEPQSEDDMVVAGEDALCIDPVGQSLETRILPPDGYARKDADAGSFLEFLRKYPVKEDGSPVLLYDGSEKWNQDAHVVVLKLPIEEQDLQQCADSIMRIYAEYFRASGQLDRISFHFTNGFEAVYSKWRDGYRIKVDGNQVTWVQSAEYDDSYETFVKYMRMVFSYAGTLSMDTEAEPITEAEIQPGDVFLTGGSPGHVVMVLDVCENELGERAFLLAQGYMPAQEFHVLKNPTSDTDPWYYEEEITYPFVTPEYVFEEGSLQRLNY